MRRRITFLTAAAVVLLALFAEHRPSKFDFTEANRVANQVISGLRPLDLMAQTPPIPSAIAVTAYATSTTAGAQTMLPAPSGNVRNYIYQVICINTSASTQDGVQIKSGSTVLAVVGCPPASINTGGVVNFNPPLRQPDVATAVTLTPLASATTLYMYMSGFTAR